MPHCPYCCQSVSAQAIACPHCKHLLKAHGHPGIPLHRAVDEVPLCQTCLYDADDTCTFPQRPNARECTLYRNQSEALKPSSVPRSSFGRNWFRHNSAWFFLLGLIAIALLLAL
jgi:C4-type Zn-finger protein